ATDPDNAALRMQRGSIYIRMPAVFNKSEVGREDLLIASKDPRFAEAAGKMLAALTKPKERFTQISASASPLIAVASVTLHGQQPIQSRKDLLELLAKIMTQIETYPGFLGSHVLTSADRPGMILLFTWWKDKSALAAWVDGAAHQGAIREIYSKRSTEGG